MPRVSSVNGEVKLKVASTRKIPGEYSHQNYLVIQAHYNDNGGFNGLSWVYRFE